MERNQIDMNLKKEYTKADLQGLRFLASEGEGIIYTIHDTILIDNGLIEISWNDGIKDICGIWTLYNALESLNNGDWVEYEVL